VAVRVLEAIGVDELVLVAGADGAVERLTLAGDGGDLERGLLPQLLGRADQAD
jgi:hypothetical protein